MGRFVIDDNYPLTQLGLTIITAFSVFFLFTWAAMIAAIPIFGLKISDITSPDIFTNLNNIELLKYLQTVQSVGLFIIPSLILGKFFSGRSVHYLKLDAAPNGIRLVWVLVIMFTALPFINLLASLNSLIKLPDFMSNVQNYMDEMSKSYQKTTEAFINVTTFTGFVINVLIIAIIPAIGEELLFRGILQRIFTNWTRNIHWGVILPAFIFSLIHFEFQGFFPRWLLGIMFGYFLVWTGNLWMPIFAHFVNNSIAVIAYYLVNKNVLNEKAIDFGSSHEILQYTVICSIMSAGGIYWLYRNRIKSQNN